MNGEGYKIPKREKRQEGRGKERSATEVLRIIMASKWKLEWRNTFKIPKQNNVPPCVLQTQLCHQSNTKVKIC